jgi:hypothetical protein
MSRMFTIGRSDRAKMSSAGWRGGTTKLINARGVCQDVLGDASGAATAHAADERASHPVPPPAERERSQ